MRRIMGPFSEFKRIPRDATRVVLCSSLRNLPFGYFNVLQGVYLVQIGIETSTVAFLLSFQLLVAVLFAIPIGILSDRGNRKLYYIVGTIGNGIGFLFYVASTDFLFLLFAGFVFGLSDALLIPPESALISSYAEGTGLTAAFSFSSSLQLITTSVGSLLAIIPDSLHLAFGYGLRIGYQIMFGMGFLIIVSGAMLVLRIANPKSEPLQESRIISRKSIRALVKFTLYQFLVGLGTGFIIPLIPLWFYLRFGVGGLVLGPMFTVQWVLLSFSYLLAPRFEKKIGVGLTVLTLQGSSVIMMLLVSLSPNYVAAAVLYVMRSILINAPGPIIQSLMMAKMSDSERGLATSVASSPFGVAWGLPNSLSQNLGGGLLQSGRLASPFYVAGGLLTTAIISFYAFFRRSESRTA